MRIASLAALAAAVAFVAPSASAQCTGTPGTDFQRVDISEINLIPQANIDQLNAAGADLDLADAQALLTNDLENEIVEVTGVIMSDPLLSGLASLVDTDDDGNPDTPGRIHYWVRDSDAATTGPAGQTIQIVDGNADGFAQGLNVGLEVTICGRVAPFASNAGGKTMQISPFAGQTVVVGAVSPDDPILDPVTVTTDDLHDTFSTADGPKSQIDWNNYSIYNNQYIRIEAADLVQGIPGDRPNMLVSSSGQDTQINTYDTSVCFGNRRGPDYFPPGNVPECVTDGDFVPPPTGVVNIQGFIFFQGYDGPFNFAIPENANWVLAPIAPEDFEVTTSPPAVVVNGPTSIPSSSDNVTITITATPGDGAITSVVVDYTYVATGTTGQATANNTSGDTYTATIPAGPDGSFVTYSVTATDANGAATTTATQSYRIFNGPVTEIAQIQETFDGGTGPSGLFTGEAAELDINLTARVQSVVQTGSNFSVTFQDDADLAPFTGIWAFVGSNPDGLEVGQEVNITGATLEEFRGDLTQLSNLTFSVVGTPGAYGYKTVPTSVLASGDAREQHEGMLIRFENVTITDVNADGDDGEPGFGEWQFTNGAEADEVRGDDQSENIPNTFSLDNFIVGATVTFIQGPWSESFGNYKVVPVETTDIGSISTASEQDAASAALALTVAPNPLRGVATIRFETPANGDVSLRVYDVTGREVAVLLDRELAAGETSATLDASGLASGVYVVRLQAGTTVATTQLSVVR